MAHSTVVKSIVVKASFANEQQLNEHSISEFGPLDLLQAFFPLNIAFVYDYAVDVSVLETALGKLLSRYPEMGGRVDQSEEFVHLSNEGAILVHLEDSVISLDDLKCRNFNFEYCLEHLKPNEPQPDVYPLGLTVQNLTGGSGMLLSFTFDHRLIDVNVCYVMIADFCSLVRTGKYEFKEVQQSIRCKHTKMDDKIAHFPHPDIRTFDSKEDMNSYAGQTMAKIFANPPIMSSFCIDSESQKQLKKDVYSFATSDEMKKAKEENRLPSTNDCIVSLTYQACFEAEAKNTTQTDNGRNMHHPPLGLFVNSRFRRNPKIPFTHIASAIIGTHTQIPKSIDISNPFSIACLVRKDLLNINEEYCQSVQAHVNKFKYCRFACMPHPTGIAFTNWNKLYDWYGGANLGKGNPIKLLPLNGGMDRACLINDAPNREDLDVYIGLTKDRLDAFLEHRNVKKYFKMN